jgi:uncharacterized delta-60 repeat protein
MKTLFTFFFSLFVICLSAQHPGDLYTDFGEEGIFAMENADTLFLANAIEVMSDGSIITAGNYRKQSDYEQQIFVSKLDKQGTPAQFGNFSHGFQYGFTDSERAKAIAILPDNKVLIAGNYHYEGENYPFVIRLFSNGQPDILFGANGVFSYALKPLNVYGMDIFYTAGSYSILLCGSANDTAEIMMLNDEGAIETSFGNNGFVQSTENSSVFVDIVTDSENNDLYATMHLFGTDNTALLKYNLPTGIPDNDFGEDGILHITESPNTIEKIIFNRGQNSLTGFGQYLTAADEFDIDLFACRFHANDGSVDNSFGVAGFLALPVPSSLEYIHSAILQSDGKYYFLANSVQATGTDTYICRLNNNGYADTTFGVNGFVQLDFGLGDNMRHTLELNPEEDIVYAAGYLDAIHDNLKIAAYHTGYNNIPPVGQAESLGKEGFIYPNPVKDVLTIETGLNGLQQVQVFDITGKEMLKYFFTDESFELNLEMLQPSVYFIRVKLPDGQAITSKLVIQ